jgi:hypothetical protein
VTARPPLNRRHFSQHQLSSTGFGPAALVRATEARHMKLRSPTLLISLLAATTMPASAGYWNYGCQGNIDGNVAVMFDRNAFVIMPKEVARGDIAGLAKSELFTFDADDNNSGLQTVMKFSRGAYPDQKVVLTEKSSKKISEQNGHVGTREKSTVMSRKLYHYERLGWENGPLSADITMDCIEYMLTAP